MKKILGLDLGTTSIGWAYVREAESPSETSEIVDLGVRVNPLSSDEQMNFERGKSITTNAERTLKRSARRSLQRYKLRRASLVKILTENQIIDNETVLAETGNHSTFQTYKLRAQAATEAIDLKDFARVLFMLNKKRGYKSSRKAKTEDGQAIDGMEIAKDLYNRNITPGQLVYERLCASKHFIPEFYPSDLLEEFKRVWNAQNKFYPEILTEELWRKLEGKNRTQTWAICKDPFQIEGIKQQGNAKEKKRETYSWRAKALHERLELEHLAIVLSEIKGQINQSSGYLGEISDRSKNLIIKKQTIGEYLWEGIQNDPHFKTKGKVFYRQDYLDEFEIIWEQQAKTHSILTRELKEEVRDTIIFFQRKLKSQKGLISFCEFESKKETFVLDGKEKTRVTGLRVAPRSSPLFQEFKIWQGLNNIILRDLKNRSERPLELEEKQVLFEELRWVKELKKSEALKLLMDNPKNFDLNLKESLQGNHTTALLLDAFVEIAEVSGHDDLGFDKMKGPEKIETLTEIFRTLGIDTAVCNFRVDIEQALDRSPVYKLWHLLYSYQEDNSKSGNQTLIRLLESKFGFGYEHALILSNLSFLPDYGSLSAKAIRKILPHLRDGLQYDKACFMAGYNHSHSLTTEENKNRELRNRLEILPKNSLRNPVVEKILNQMIHVVNGAFDQYGKPDEIRIELARDLKKSASERQEIFKQSSALQREHEKYREILKTEFGLTHISRNDIIRYKLYKELETRGYRTLYSNTYIPAEELFGKKFDIEHIIPQSRFFDDSFSNKTLESSEVNRKKGNRTALSFVREEYGVEAEALYRAAVEEAPISGTKKKRLLTTDEGIPSDFLNRDIGDTRYIARKAMEMLKEVCTNVHATSGTITARLREDWGLTEVMRELNWDKYKALGLTKEFTNDEGNVIKRIVDWTKRNDHRHHAMDALTVAFTKPSHIQYLNNLNARSDLNSVIYGIEKKELERDKNNKLRFISPIPHFRSVAKKKLEEILISHKAKNKVVTRNRNKPKNGSKTQIALTPRGQLHKESVYGRRLVPIELEIKIGPNLKMEQIQKVKDRLIKEALIERIEAFDGDPEKAFGGKNSLKKNPIYLRGDVNNPLPEKIKIKDYEEVFAIRKAVDANLNISKVADPKIKKLLEDRVNEVGDIKKAFLDLDRHPIYLNREKQITVKRVTIYESATVLALHNKRDQKGRELTNELGRPIPTDFVAPGNNHHVAIYRDEHGELQEKVVSFFEAVERVNQGLPIIDRNYNETLGWKFVFSLKQNEMFIFPNEATGFDPSAIDLLDPKNRALISPYLYRVQKLSSQFYVFRHHLETTVEDRTETFGITYKRIRSPKQTSVLKKVRLDHLGQIVHTGE